MNVSSIMKRTLPYMPFLLLVGNSHVLSETQRDLDSHEHGASILNVVIDANKVYVELESPWVNLVGFEHQPSTQSQLTAMSDAMKALVQPSGIISFNTSSGCLNESAEASSTVELAISDKQQGDEEHHDEAHKDEEHHDEHPEENQHSEVVATYTFACTDPSSLEQLSVGLFELYPGIEDIDVQVAGPSGQAGFELNPDANTIDLTAVR